MTLETRFVQMKTIRKAIATKTATAKPNELILMCGDMNVNGGIVDKYKGKYYQLIRKKEGFDDALDDFAKEYQVMIDILSNYGEDEVIDVIRLGHNGISPITYGDFKLDENGNEVPLETEMFFPEDYCSKQSLDYIFEIRRSFNVKKEENKDPNLVNRGKKENSEEKKF